MTKEKIESKKPQHAPDDDRSKKGQSAEHRKLEAETKKNNPTEAQQRNSDREKQTGRGSGEGISGMQRGDGHPTGR